MSSASPLDAPSAGHAPGSVPPDVDGLRILAFCDYYSPSSPGGSERVAAEVYRRLAEWGARITVVGGVPTAIAAPAGCRASQPEVVALPARDLSGLVGAQLAVSGRLLPTAFRLADRHRPHVLTAQSLHFQSSVVAALCQARRRIPLVTTVHVAGLDDLRAPVRLATAAYEATVGRFILARSAAVIAVSDAVGRHLDGRVDPRLLRIVPNGVDHELIRPTPRPTAGPPVIVFVGRLIANKGPATLLRALGRLHRQAVGFRCVVLGDGPLRRELEAEVDRGGLRAVVEFKGTVTDVASYLATADIFVRPSSTEGMSLALLEAMAAGLAVVVSDIPANASVVEDGQNGLLVPVGDDDTLASRLRAVLAEPGVRRRLGDAARHVAERHSWERTARETSRLLLQASGYRAG